MDSFDVSIGYSLEVDSSDQAVGEALEATLRSGHPVGGDTKSVELLNLDLQVRNPRDRLLSNPNQPIGLVSSVARFVWMMGGNERLQDILIYQPRVKGYSDDELTVPGSNYGKRLISPRPGLNQIEGVIGRLSESNRDSEGSTRRAAGVIWQPDDAVRLSKDIPCAFGVMYAIRGEKLVAKTIMRSNNAVTLLHVNLFEFGLLAEIIAAEVGVELGPLLHSVFSFHILDSMENRARGSIEGWEQIRNDERSPMPPMPTESPLEETRVLAKLESRLRHETTEIRNEEPEELLGRGAELNEYWLGFYRVLLVDSVCRLGRLNAAREVVESLPSYFKDDMVAHIRGFEEGASGSSSSGQLFEHDDFDEQVSLEPSDPIDALRSICDEIESEMDIPISMKEYLVLEDRLVTSVEARRSDDFSIKKEDVSEELRAIRRPRRE